MKVLCLFNLHRWTMYGAPDTLFAQLNGAHIDIGYAATTFGDPKWQKRTCTRCGINDVRPFTESKAAPATAPIDAEEMRLRLRSTRLLLWAVAMVLFAHATNNDLFAAVCHIVSVCYAVASMLSDWNANHMQSTLRAERGG